VRAAPVLSSLASRPLPEAASAAAVASSSSIFATISGNGVRPRERNRIAAQLLNPGPSYDSLNYQTILLHQDSLDLGSGAF
jgi:hypothetical protein